MKTIFTQLFMFAFISHAITQSNAHGGSMPTNDDMHTHHACVSEAQRISIKARLESQKQQLLKDKKIKLDDRAIIQFVWPVANANNNDEYNSYGVSNYVDHNNNYPYQLSDYNCQDRTYDLSGGYNHQGLDIYLWPFSWYKMENNHVAVVAGADGVILDKIDGNYDKNCTFNNNSWNAVYVIHADGSIAWYGHLKSGSLTNKSVGQSVSAGEFLGYIGSSGSSTGPHLHLEIYDGNNNLIDPYVGPCNDLNTESWWINQKPHTDPHVNTLYVHSAPPDFKSCPQTEDVNITDEVEYNVSYNFAAYYNDQQEGHLSSFRILRPNGSIYSQWTHLSPSTYYSSYWYWTRTIYSSEPSGTWTFEMDYQGVTYERKFTIQSTEECDPVEDITLESSTTDQLDISWSPSGSPDYYIITWYDDAGVNIGEDEVTNNDYSITNLMANTVHCIDVVAVCGSQLAAPTQSCYTTQPQVGSYLWSNAVISGGNSDAPDFLPEDIRDTFTINEPVYATAELLDVYFSCYLETEFYDPNGSLIFTGMSTVTNESGYTEWARSYSFATPDIPGQYTVDFYATPENSERQLQATKNFIVEETTSTHTVASPEVTAYPNPFSTHVTICNIKNSDIIIRSIEGKIIHADITKNENHAIINFSHLPHGLYIASVTQGGITHNLKILCIR